MRKRNKLLLILICGLSSMGTSSCEEDEIDARFTELVNARSAQAENLPSEIKPTKRQKKVFKRWKKTFKRLKENKVVKRNKK